MSQNSYEIMKKAKTFSLNLISDGLYIYCFLSPFFKQGHIKFGISLAFNCQSSITVFSQVLFHFHCSKDLDSWKYKESFWEKQTV